MNVTEVRDSNFKNAFTGIFNFTVGILEMTCKHFEYNPFIKFILKHPTGASLTWSTMRNGLRSEVRRNILDKVKNSKDNKVKSIDFGWFSKRFLKLVTPAWSGIHAPVGLS